MIEGHRQKAQEPLAIIGMSCLFPEADSLDEFWNHIKHGRDLIQEIPATHWSPTDYFDQDPKKQDHTYAKRGGFLRPYRFQPLKYGIAPQTLEATDTTQLLGMVVAEEAMRQAGYGPERSFDRDRVSCILGVTGTLELVIPLGARLGHPHWRQAMQKAGLSQDVIHEIMDDISSSYVGWQEASFPGLLGNVVAGRIANRLDLGGTNSVVDAACASSLAALNLAALELQSGKADMVLTGGMDTFNDIFMYMCFSKTPALSPSGDARPFDADGDGTILGEGLGAIVLKRLSDAEKAGDRIYAVIRSIASSSDGKGKAIYAPSAKGQVKALRKAYESVDIDPSTVQLIECHGTGTKVGDGVEITALTEVFPSRAEDKTTLIGSVKSQIGHTKAAAGTAGLIKVAMALYHKVLPPTIKINHPHPKLESSPFAVTDKAKPWPKPLLHPRRGAVSAFGFGGSNFHCVLEEHQIAKPAVDYPDDFAIFPFAADSKPELLKKLDDLQQQIKQLVSPLKRYQILALANQTMAQVPRHGKERFVMLVPAQRDLNESIDQAIAMLKNRQEEEWQHSNGFYYGRKKDSGSLAFVFSGQGSQYVGMLRSLAVQFPEFLTNLEHAERIWAEFNPGTSHKLSDLVYPNAFFHNDQRAVRESLLKATNVAQPAIGSVSISLFEILSRFGIKPDLVGGHSFGELSALYAAGVFSRDDFYRTACLRGQLMQNLDSNLGRMLVIRSSREEVQKVIEDEGLGVVIANHNAPNQVVVAGSELAIVEAQERLKGKGLSVVPLNVAAAFHSPIVAPAVSAFFQGLNQIELRKPTIPVFSNVGASLYSTDQEESRQKLASQIAEPVEFVKMIRNMYEHGARTFVELGPQKVLQGLMHSILGNHETPASIMSIDDAGSDNDWFGLLRVLVRLFTAGYSVKWDEIRLPEDHSQSVSKSDFYVDICGANYRAPRAKVQSMKPHQETSKSHNGTLHDKAFGISSEYQERRDSRVSSNDLREHRGSPTIHPSRPKTNVTQFQQLSDHPSPAEINSSAKRSLSKSDKHRVLRQEGLKMPNKDSISGADQQGFVSSERQGLDTLNLLEKHLLVLQEMQTKNADLHQKFLEGQMESQRMIQSLLDDYRTLTGLKDPNENRPYSTTPSMDRQGAKVRDTWNDAPKTSVISSSQPDDLNSAFVSSTRVEASVPQTVTPKLSETVPSIHEYNETDASTYEASDNHSINHEQDDDQSFPVRSSEAKKAGEATDLILKVVAEKTGYPVEMLNESMSLEADLGIDSIKRVEIFSSLQETIPEMEHLGPEQLHDADRIGDIVKLIRSVQSLDTHTDENVSAMMPTNSIESQHPQVASTKQAVASETSHSDFDPSQALAMVQEIIADKTGYPLETLEAHLSLEADLGVDSIKRVEIFSDLQSKLGREDAFHAESLNEIQTIQDLVRFVCSQSHDFFERESDDPSKPDEQTFVRAELSDSKQNFKIVAEMIAEKTGYPVGMLNGTMTLEQDLGIDSIKRVEILSVLGDSFPSLSKMDQEVLSELLTIDDLVAATFQGIDSDDNVPFDANLKLSQEMIQNSTQTVNPSIVDESKEPLLVSHSLPDGGSQDPGPGIELQTNLIEKDLQIDKDYDVTLGVVAESVYLERSILKAEELNELESDYIRYPKEAKIWVTDDGSNLARNIVLKLREKGYKPRLVSLSFVDRMKAPDALDGLILLSPLKLESSVSKFLTNAFKLVKLVGAALRKGDLAENEVKRFLSIVTRNGGYLGLNGLENGSQVYGGALFGLAKTLRFEWPEIHVSAIDLGRDFADGFEAANRLLDACRQTRWPELGVLKHQYVKPVLEVQEQREVHELSLSSDDTILITGGGRGVTFAIAERLARDFQCRLVLWGRTQLDGPAEPEWLQSLEKESEIIKALKDHLGPQVSLRQLQKEARQILTRRQLKNHLETLTAYGSEVIYQSVDVRSDTAIAAALDHLEKQYGSVQGLVHGAGVLADRFIDDLDEQDFAMVIETKVRLLAHLERPLFDEIKICALFSSSTGRFGRRGQVAYAVANEALNKFAHYFSLIRPQCRTVALNWGPWDGGMVDESLKKIFEKEGLALIPMPLGAQFLLQELGQGDRYAREVVVLAKERELDLDEGKSPSNHAYPIIDHLKISESSIPVLTSHVIKGQMVFPVVLHLELMIQKAKEYLPDLFFQGFRDFKLLRGIKLGPHDTSDVRISLRNQQGISGGLTAHMILEVWNSEKNEWSLSSSVEVWLVEERIVISHPTLQVVGEFETPEAEQIYRDFLFHGPAMQGIESVSAISRQGAEAWVNPVGSIRDWLPTTMGDQWNIDPLALDCGFQMGVVWSSMVHNLRSLPLGIHSYIQYQEQFPTEGCQVRMVIHDVRAREFEASFEFIDRNQNLIASLKGYRAIMDDSLTVAFRHSRLDEMQ